MCDRQKRFLWCCPSNNGSAHDSAAFSGSRLCDPLKETAHELEVRGPFIAGDSACGVAPCLVTPCDVTEMKEDLKAKHAFNFCLSSCRIHIECAFGELIMQWGIFWRTLGFDLAKSCRIVQAAMSLQNFIIEQRESRLCDSECWDFTVKMDSSQEQLTRQTGEMPRALASDNDEPHIGGCRSVQGEELRPLGSAVRHRLTIKLACDDMEHPMPHDMECNSHGHIHMEH